MSGPKPARKPATVVPKHGHGKLLAGGQFGNNGGKLGGRPPDEFKAICQELASNAQTIAAARAILKDKKHPAWTGALKWATENGYGKPDQSVDLTSGGEKLTAAVIYLPANGRDASG